MELILFYPDFFLSTLAPGFPSPFQAVSSYTSSFEILIRLTGEMYAGRSDELLIPSIVYWLA